MFIDIYVYFVLKVIIYIILVSCIKIFDIFLKYIFMLNLIKC